MATNIEVQTASVPAVVTLRHVVYVVIGYGICPRT